MHKNKVILVLKSLSPDEIRQLDKFVRSPVHNQHEEVIRFFQYVRKHLNGGERGLDKERVFAQVFPNDPFNMQQLHYISSYLLKVVEEFLAWQEWRMNQQEYQVSLLRSLRHHKLEALFDRNFEKAIETQSLSPHQDISFLYYHYLLEVERFRQDRLSTGKQEFRLQELSDTLDAFFIAEKLRNACVLLSNQVMGKSSYSTGLLSEVLNYVKGHELLKNPLVAVYYHASRTLQNFEDDEAFRNLKQLLTEHRESFNINELHDIFIFATNYCIRRLNNGEQGFRREVFDIYKMGMESNAFVQNNIMTPRTYSNIVFFGLRMGEFSWVENFIFQNKDSLPEKQREGFFNYNLARFYYEKQNFSEAMPLLLQMEYEDVLLTCLGKILLAKMYFEDQEMESLGSLLQSFRAYVGRKKTLGYHGETFLNFIHFTQKLIQNQFSLTQPLRKEITDTKVVAEKEWLLAQL